MQNIIPLNPRRRTTAPTPEQLEQLLSWTAPDALTWAQNRMLSALLSEELSEEDLAGEATEEELAALAELEDLAEDLPGDELLDGVDGGELAELARLDACWDVYGGLLHEYLDGRLPLDGDLAWAEVA